MWLFKFLLVLNVSLHTLLFTLASQSLPSTLLLLPLLPQSHHFFFLNV